MTSPWTRTIRYQGAIVRGHELLIIHYQPVDTPGFWLLPGGGREDETEVECVAREMLEETHLVVRVERLLLDGPAPRIPGVPEMYERLKTYLCTAVSGTPRPGVEPETEAQGDIDRVAWLDLRDESGWDEAVKADDISYPQFRAIAKELGFA